MGADEKTKRALVEVEDLANKLRIEQAHSNKQTNMKRVLGSKIADTSTVLAQANEIAAVGGRNAMARLETRISELESKLGSIQASTGETHKAYQRASVILRSFNSKAFTKLRSMPADQWR